MPRLGEETFATGLASCAGGGAFITAATVSALGAKADLFANLPAAPFDQIVMHDITSAGVSAKWCKAAQAGLSPQLTVATVTGGDRSFLTHNAGIALPDEDLHSGPWQHLHIGELRALVDNPRMLAQARIAGISISVDCGWDELLVHDGSRVGELLKGVDVFLPNEAEFEALTSSGFSEDAPVLLVIKQGARGASAKMDGAWQHHSGTTANVLDTTGAGDAFNGGFLVSWIAGDPLDTCLAVANCCGAASVTSVGGTSGLSVLQGELANLRSQASE